MACGVKLLGNMFIALKKTMENGEWGSGVL